MNRYRQILQSTTEFAVVVADRNGTVTEWNTGAERVLGWTEDEIVGRSLATIFTPDDRAAGRMEFEMADALREGRGVDERWHLKKGDVRFWASGEMMPLRADDGEHVGFVKILRDRTEQHLAGRQLVESELRLRQAQEAGGVGLFDAEIATGMVVGTPEFSRLYGLEHRDIRPSSEVEATVLSEDRALVSTDAMRREGQAHADVEYRVRHGETGEIRWISRKGEVRFDAEGRPARFVGVARDVTGQRAAQDALADSEGRYRALFEAIDDGYCIIEFFDGPHGPDSDYVHVEANAGYERQSGIPGIVSMTLRELAPEEADGWVELYGRVLRTGEPTRFERKFPTANRIIEVSASRIEPASRRQVSVLFRDITERRRLETERREGEERLRLAIDVGEVGLWELDIASGELTLDARMRGMNGVAGDELDTAGAFAAVHPDDRTRLEADLAKLTAGEAETLTIHYRVIGIEDGVVRTVEVHGRAVRNTDGETTRLIGAARDITGRVAADARREILNRELAHRLKNTLAMVQSIATQTMRSSPDMASARKTLTDRIGALSRAHDILLAGQRDAGGIRSIVLAATSLHDEGGLVRTAGPDVALGPKAAMTLSLIVHELATNAGKYGALSVEDGRVDVAWTITPDAQTRRPFLKWEWRETGGPAVTAPEKKSFGTRLIEMGLSGSSAGTAELEYAPDGLVCRITASLTELQSDDEPEA